MKFQVGQLAVQGGAWETARFHRNFAQGSQPVVITHVQTTNDPTYVKTRQQQSDNTGFQVTLEEIGSSDFGFADDGSARAGNAHVHGTETVGWIAFEAGHGHLGILQFEAGNTPERVSAHPETVTFASPFSSIPRFFGSIATHNGGDSSQLRQDETGGISTTSATFYIEEEECVDQEGGNEGCNEYIAGNGCHPNTEVVSWLAISPANWQRDANGQYLNGGGYMNGNAAHTVGYQTAASTGDGSYISARQDTWPLAEIGEQGTATINTGWLVVSLKGNYRNPVIFCSVPSQNGGDASVCRVQRLRFAPPVQRIDMNDDGSRA